MEVEWVDSFGSPHWVSPDDIPDLLAHLPALSVGYLVSDTSEAIVLVMGVGGQEQHLNQMAIPRPAVKKITYLRGKP